MGLRMESYILNKTKGENTFNKEESCLAQTNGCSFNEMKCMGCTIFSVVVQHLSISMSCLPFFMDVFCTNITFLELHTISAHIQKINTNYFVLSLQEFSNKVLNKLN